MNPNSHGDARGDRLKVGQIVRCPGGSFGTVVTVSDQTCRVKCGGKTFLHPLSEMRSRICRGRFEKVFHGDDNVTAEIWIENDAGSFRLMSVVPGFDFAFRFWWGKGDGEAYRLRRLQTAAAILSKVPGVEKRIVETFVDRFADQVILHLTPRRFWLVESEIREWLEMASAELAAEGVGHEIN